MWIETTQDEEYLNKIRELVDRHPDEVQRCCECNELCFKYKKGYRLLQFQEWVEWNEDKGTVMCRKCWVKIY